MATPEGRAVYVNGSWQYEFFYTDHLGNTRVAFRANGNQLVKTSETAFDPFGVVLRGAGQVNGYQNRFEYQNKEKESTFGLNRISLGARTYNPTTGRMDGVDNYADKYFGLSTFQYSANNPMMFRDDNGDSLVVNYFDANHNAQTLHYGYTEQSGYGFYNSDGTAYTGGDKFVNQVSDALARLGLGKEGRQMVDFLSNDAQTVTIGMGKNTFNEVTNTVGFNPNSNTNIPTESGTNGMSKAPTFISLGHELAHSEDHLKGTLNRSTTWNGYEEAEKYSTHRENQFRGENGLPLRTHYGVVEDPATLQLSPASNSRIIDSKGNSLFFKPYNYRRK